MVDCWSSGCSLGLFSLVCSLVFLGGCKLMLFLPSAFLGYIPWFALRAICLGWSLGLLVCVRPCRTKDKTKLETHVLILPIDCRRAGPVLAAGRVQCWLLGGFTCFLFICIYFMFVLFAFYLALFSFYFDLIFFISLS